MILPELPASLIEKWDRPAPRYTSYPTAPHFEPAFPQARHKAWLAALGGALPPGDAVSLYIHIPFCAKLCTYCGCHTRIVNDYSPAQTYTDALLSEIESVTQTTGHGLPVAHIHFGGGTPTFLRNDDLSAILEKLRASFSVRDDAEIAMEIDPRTIAPDRAARLAEMGVNRISFGIQDFDPQVQNAINRIQSRESVEALMTAFRDAGISGVNFDLMYGLPAQTPQTIRETIETSVALGPTRFAVFGYAHVPWFKKHQSVLERYHLPGAAERYELFRIASMELADRGFVPVGMDHFARPEDPLVAAQRTGRLRRNFQGYTTDSATTLLGFGTSSISALPQGYVQNTPDINAYQTTTIKDDLPTLRGRALSAADRLRGAKIEALMCRFETDLTGLTTQEQQDIESRLAPVIADGFARIEKNGQALLIRIPDRGRPFVRLVCMTLDAYYEDAPARHARAV